MPDGDRYATVWKHSLSNANDPALDSNSLSSSTDMSRILLFDLLQSTFDSRRVESQNQVEENVVSKPKIYIQSARSKSDDRASPLEIQGDITPEQLQQSGFGYVCRRGLTKAADNQDSFCIIRIEGCFWMIAVFDGHGEHGGDVSDFACRNLPKFLVADPGLLTNPKESLLSAFRKTQDLLAAVTQAGTLDSRTSGTTATVCLSLHSHNVVHAAYVGDSTAVLAAPDQQASAYSGRQLIYAHRPRGDGEKERICSSGGQVFTAPEVDSRAFLRGKAYPGITVSRALGDLRWARELGISPAASYSCAEVTHGGRQLLIVCSFGVWRYTTLQDAVEAAGRALQAPGGGVAEAARAIGNLGWDGWVREVGGAVVEDLTVVVVDLQRAQAPIVSL